MALALDALHAMENAMLDRGVHTDPEHPHRQALNFGCTARNALRNALDQSPALALDEMQPVYEEGCRAGRKAALAEVLQCLTALVESLEVLE